MGITIERITGGDGQTFPRKGDTVEFRYVGTLADGNQFHSSRVPFITQIGVGKVIKGWDEGIVQMSAGEKCVITATPDYAYGARSFPPIIPPDATLKFEIELLRIN